MNGEAPRVSRQRTLASLWPREETHPPLTSISGARAVGVSGVRQVVEAVGRCISLDATELPEEFFPAHLSVAIVEAVFRIQLEPQAQSSQVAQRYCRRFGLTHRRRNMFELPPADEQETVADLIAHYDKWGVEGMVNEVFETSFPLPETTMCRADTVLHTAQALRNIGVRCASGRTGPAGAGVGGGAVRRAGNGPVHGSLAPDVRGRRRFRRGRRPCAAIRRGGERASHGVGGMGRASRASGCVRDRPLAEVSGLSDLPQPCRVLANCDTEAGRSARCHSRNRTASTEFRRQSALRLPMEVRQTSRITPDCVAD